MFLLQNAREHCADVAMGGGLTLDDPRLDREINDACQELLLQGNWKLSVFRYTIFTTGGVLRLPWFMETVLSCRINGHSAYPWSMHYEFNPAGPGTIPSVCDWSRDLVDIGKVSPLQFPMSSPSRLMVTTDAEEAEGASIVLRGTNKSNLEIFNNGVPGETILLNRNKPYYTRNDYKNVTATFKGPTNGFIRIQTYNPDDPTAQGSLLSTYHPSEENPAYRLYRVKASRGGLESVDALVKLAYFRARHPTDMVLIQNMPALKLAVQALHERRNRNFDESDKLFGDAKGLLASQLQDRQPKTPEVHSQVGTGMNFRMVI